MAPTFSKQEREDTIRAFDEYLEMVYEDYEDGEESYRLYLRRVARLFYVWTGMDWQAASGFSFTQEGRYIV